MRLNKSQKYAIQWMVSQGQEITQIVKELKIPTVEVEKFIEKNCNINKDASIKTTTSRATAKDLMIRHSESKRINNVAIMTKEASEMGDHFKKNMNNQTAINRHADNIHKIYDQ